MLKEITDGILKKQNRSLSWLAAEMGKTFDGLKLSLTKESIKYTDLKRMAEILQVSPAVFFNAEPVHFSSAAEDERAAYGFKNELQSCRELTEALKSQLKDKEYIIQLLSHR